MIPLCYDAIHRLAAFKINGIIWELEDKLRYATTHQPNMTPEKLAQSWQKNRGKLDALREMFPKNCWYMRWNYGEVEKWEGNAAALDWYKENGFPRRAFLPILRDTCSTKTITRIWRTCLTIVPSGCSCSKTIFTRG